MKFPATSDQLKSEGYMYDNDAKCRGCGEPIEWWITPNGKKMPLRVEHAGSVLTTSAEVRKPHWDDCPNAGDFRK